MWWGDFDIFIYLTTVLLLPRMSVSVFVRHTRCRFPPYDAAVSAHTSFFRGPVTQTTHNARSGRPGVPSSDVVDVLE